jgi:hypothetical protein
MKAVLVERALQMSRRSLLALVKNNELSRDELRVVISDLAAAKREKDQTRKQAYDAFITKDALGMELHRHYTAAGPLSADQS